MTIVAVYLSDEQTEELTNLRLEYAKHDPFLEKLDNGEFIRFILKMYGLISFKDDKQKAEMDNHPFYKDMSHGNTAGLAFRMRD